LQYKEIAGELGIKYLTVVTIKNNIFRKLGINNTIELVLYAIKKELITL
ncbi:MAG: DNA-binding response regulator, partial [Bacteroidales bacterium]|nr:DNA-binding response regulator [Bacteroidales bacterium]